MTRPHNTTRWYYSWVSMVLRMVLFPFRVVTNMLVPSLPLDGLTPAVTAKASLQFVHWLQQVQNEQQQQQNEEQSPIRVSDLWVSDMGFAAVQQQAIQSNKLLLVYVHSNLHPLAISFVQTVLLSKQFMRFCHSHKDSLLCWGATLQSAQGVHVANLVNATAFPAIVLLHKQAILIKAQGPALLSWSLDSILYYCQQCTTRHAVLQQEQLARQFQLQQEQELRRQQDWEYQQSLLADQEREKQAQQQALQQQQEQQALQQQQENDLLQKQQRLVRAKSYLREEPDPSTPETTAIRFVLPSGTKLLRRFYYADTIATLKAYLVLHFHQEQQDDDMTMERIGLSTSFPRKTFHDQDDTLTLKDTGLIPQAVLMVQDLDA